MIVSLASSVYFWSCDRVGIFGSCDGEGAEENREEEKGERREVQSHVGAILCF
jgi:hypothetical protein